LHRTGLRAETAGMSKLVMACVLLLGIVLVCYGYFTHERLMLGIGLGVTIMGLVTGILQIVVHPRR
jgi:hypothetical protein